MTTGILIRPLKQAEAKRALREVRRQLTALTRAVDNGVKSECLTEAEALYSLVFDIRKLVQEALTIGEIARAEAVSVEADWEGNPHRHPGQLGGRMCHKHDDFGYHCHDLAARPGAEPGRMYR